jgi:hypothetical protein
MGDDGSRDLQAGPSRDDVAALPTDRCGNELSGKNGAVLPNRRWYGTMTGRLFGQQRVTSRESCECPRASREAG